MSPRLKLAVLTAPQKERSRFLSVLASYKATPNDQSASAARVAAEGLGRLRDKPSVPIILETIGPASKDLVLEQSLIRALIDIEAAAPTRAGLKAANPAIQRGALIALDQMDGSDLKPTEVVPFLSATDERLRTTANWILSHHPDWGGELAGWFRQRLTASDLADAERAALDNQLHILTRAEVSQQLLADAITQPGFRS